MINPISAITTISDGTQLQHVQKSFEDLSFFAPPPTEEESMESPEPKSTALDECITDITHVITCLYDLSITIRNPAPKDRLEKSST